MRYRASRFRPFPGDPAREFPEQVLEIVLGYKAGGLQRIEPPCLPLIFFGPIVQLVVHSHQEDPYSTRLPVFSHILFVIERANRSCVSAPWFDPLRRPTLTRLPDQNLAGDQSLLERTEGSALDAD